MALGRLSIAAIGVAVLAMLPWPAGAAADTTLPCSPGALAGAFDAADAPGASELILAPGCQYEIDTTLSLSAAGTDVSVVGNGATIDGGEAVRGFSVEDGAQLRLENLSVIGGDAQGGDGGALYVESGGAAELERVTLDGNSGTYGGAISVYGDLAVTDSAILNNTASSDAGAIEVYGSGTLEMAGSLVTGNTASSYAGGISVMYGGAVEVVNSTFTGNGLSSGSSGGAFYSYDSTLSLRNVTVTGNTANFGGGIYASETALDIRNSIVAENLPSGASNRDCYFSGGTPTGASNLTTSGTGGSACASTGFASTSAASLGLSPLADNGGSTQTFALGPASSARGAATSDCPATDQRGYPRPGPSSCDIGAYQNGSVITIDDAAAVEGDSGAATLSFPVTVGPPVSEQVTVGYEIDNVTTDGGDFDPDPVDGELLLDPGETSGAIEVEVSGDHAVEPDETFTVTLTGVTTAGADVALGRSVATGTIINEDQPDHEHPGCSGGVGDVAALYESIAWANTNGQDDTIHLAQDCEYDTAGRPALRIGPDGGHSVAIDGNGATVDGAGEHVVLIVQPDSDLTLDRVTIRDGLNPGTSFGDPGTDGYGGGMTIDNADVAVIDSRFESNVAGGDAGGDLGGSGGAIFIFEGSLDVTRSTFAGNRAGWGGAIEVQASENPVDVDVVDSAFSDNDADFYGGAIETSIGSHWGGSGSVSVLGSTLEGNHANLGGGALDVSDGHLSVVNSTIVGNSAGKPGFSQNGGALRVNSGGDDSAAKVINTTMLGNTATGPVDGITGGSRVTVKNSILAGAAPGFSCPNGNSGMSVANSLSDDVRCGSTPGFTVRTPTAALALGALADNGGPTETVALRSGSPAVDAGDQAVCATELPQDGGLPVDQRGWQRGLNPPNPCDIGAYEADRMRIGDASGAEGTDTELTFEVTLDAPAMTDVSVDYTTENGTAHAGTDYVSTSGTLEIEQGETAGEIVVDLIDNDEFGGEREFYVNLTNAAGAAAVVAQGTGTITEDDSPVLTVELTGSGTGRVTGSGGGIECGLGGSQCSQTVTQGEQVELTAEAGPNSVFTGWSGGGCSGTGSCTVTMDQSHTVSANFDLVTHELTVSKTGNGAGTVTSDPAGIDCGTSCESAYDHGTEVTLTPAPATGSEFTGWSGACTGTGDCVVTMDEARNVTATFTLQERLLTVAAGGNGIGTITGGGGEIDCGNGATDCEAQFDYGTEVTLTATPATGSDFTGWSGACTGTGDCVVTMDEARNVTATFTLQTRRLTVAVDGDGAGRVTSADGEIDCGQGATDCEADYDYGASVTLTAQPNPDSIFTGWSGACTGTGDCQVTMAEAASATATFTRRPHTLTVDTGGNGRGVVTSSDGEIDCGQGATDCESEYPYGTEVTLTATPDPASEFTGWTGACTGTDDCVVTMDEARNVTATFTLKPKPLRNLTVQVHGQGKVTGLGIDCGDGATDCSASFEEDTEVTLTAAPAPGWRLGAFTSPCRQSGDRCLLTMRQDRAVTATFAEVKPPPPGNNFRLRGFKSNPKRGTGSLPVILPGPGKVVLVGPRFRKVSSRVHSEGKMELGVKVRPGPALRRLNNRGRLRARLRVTYTPAGGTPRTKRRQVTLVKRVAGE